MTVAVLSDFIFITSVYIQIHESHRHNASCIHWKHHRCAISQHKKYIYLFEYISHWFHSTELQQQIQFSRSVLPQHVRTMTAMTTTPITLIASCAKGFHCYLCRFLLPFHVVYIEYAIYLYSSSRDNKIIPNIVLKQWLTPSATMFTVHCSLAKFLIFK